MQFREINLSGNYTQTMAIMAFDTNYENLLSGYGKLYSWSIAVCLI
jgi:hypothetical protein